METSHFQISVVSADQRLPSQTVEVEAGWTTIDLKRHLSKVYPGEPPIDSQKLIFAGRILPDNSELSTLIGQEPFSKIVHLVLSPSVANQAKAAMATKSVSEYSPDELTKLQEQYLKYLNDYYRDQGAAISQFSFAQHAGDSRVINVEIGIEENVEPAEEPEEEIIERNVLQRFAGAFGFRMGAGAEAMDARNDGEEGFDLFDFAYAIFRTSLLVAICVTYASWQRLAIVFVVGLYFYWRNGARQLELRRQQQLQRLGNLAGHPQPPPLRQEQQPQTSNEGQAARAETNSTTAAAATHPPTSEASPGGAAATTTTGSEQQQQQDVGASASVAESEQGRVTRLVQSLRFAGSTSVRLVCAIFSSLVPELPPAGRFD